MTKKNLQYTIKSNDADVDKHKTHQKNGELKEETEAFILAAQDKGWNY